MELIDGKKIADQILADLKREIAEKNLQPCLAVILIGDDPASFLYLQKKEEAAQKIGIKIERSHLSERTSEKEILDLVDSLNKNSRISGILIQLPLPDHLTADKIIQAIRRTKDVDGFVKESPFESPFILAIWQALLATGQKLRNKKIVALVNSDIFGRALGRFFKDRELEANYILSANLGTKLLNFRSLASKVKKADIVITALGRANLIKGKMIKPGAILIDGGISKIGDKIVGDVDQESVREKAGWLTPVPGGLGPLTVAFLLKNVVLASQKAQSDVS